MRDFWKIVSVVVVLSLSVFLIQRSCHDDSGRYDPDKGGGIGGVALKQRVPEPEVGSSSQAVATPGSADAAEAEAVTARNKPSPDKESEGVRAQTETARSDEEKVRRYQRTLEGLQGNSVDSARNTSSAAANSANTTQQIQGTWILVDPNDTILELTVVNDSGSLRMYRSQSARSDSVARNVRIYSEGRSIWVLTSDADESVSRMFGREPLRLAFLFDTSASPHVLRISSREKEPAQLRVVAHTK